MNATLVAVGVTKVILIVLIAVNRLDSNMLLENALF